MSDARERLIQLAERGTPRGFDDVFEAAARNATLGVVEGDADDGVAIPYVTDEPLRRRAPRRRMSSLIAAAGMAALLAVGTLAISAVVGSGGASSPEDAVQRLADAISHEDPLAAADLMAPSEVRSLDDTLDAAAKKAQELSLVQTASAPLAGVDLNVNDLKLSTENLADGYAKVTVDGGSLSASTTKSKFSALLQKALNDYQDNSASVDLTTLSQSLDNVPVFVMAVKQDGRWYISAGYTLMEYIREANHAPAADFGSGVRAEATLGADTPDAAVQDALHAWAASDWTKLMSLAPPDELPVYDYRAAISQLATDTTNNLTVDSIQTSSQVDGDTARVSLTASGTSNGNAWTWKDGCYTSTPEGGTAQDASHTCVAGRFRFIYLPIGEGPDASASTTIRVVRENGRWFISPVGSVLDVLDRAIENMTQRDLYTLLNVPWQLPADGTLELGKPITVPRDGSIYHVYSFEAHAGERVLGLATQTPTPKYGPEVGGEFFTADGSHVDGGVFYGTATQFNADGTYKLVISSSPTATVIGFTVYDEQDAPAAAKNPQSNYCSYDGNGVQSCFGSASGSLDGGSGGATATSVPVVGSNLDCVKG
ncbi:MAG TPA: hypothetical protein VFR41_06925, partial [Acidimicrobiia bacterium]|nr:hypothetical protein [Acidimicrobiia bacterium]